MCFFANTGNAFSEPIRAVNGTVTVYADDSLTPVFSDTITGSTVHIAGNTLSLHLPQHLAYATSYRVAFDGNTIQDLIGHAFPSAYMYYGFISALSPVALNLVGTDGYDTLHGSDPGDTLAGGAGVDSIYGHGGDDLIHGGDESLGTYGGDYLEGGDGNDTVYGDLGHDRLQGGTGTDQLTGTAGNDGLVGVAGQAYRFYRAAFDRTPDLPGLGFWIGAMDKGSSVQDLAAGFSASKEFTGMYGGASNADIVGRLYHNVLHRTPEQAGFDYWLGVLDNKLASLPDVLAAISESAENKDAVADLIASGILFTPWQG